MMVERDSNVSSDESRRELSQRDLLSTRPVAINVGIKELFESLHAQDVQAIHVSWQPPADGDEELIALLDKVL